MKIMIIDDEPDICVYLKAVLEDNGYEPLVIEKGQPVLKTILSHRPDLILLDIIMPKRSGISIYKEIRNKPELNSLPIIITSGMTSAQNFMAEDFRNLVQDDSIVLPDGYLEKPVQLEELFKLIEQLTQKGK